MAAEFSSSEDEFSHVHGGDIMIRYNSVFSVVIVQSHSECAQLTVARFFIASTEPWGISTRFQIDLSTMKVLESEEKSGERPSELVAKKYNMQIAAQKLCQEWWHQYRLEHLHEENVERVPHPTSFPAQRSVAYGR